ncbi:MAG: 2OG-Fe(II) oxygenase [Pseudomonadota bacterium]
MVDDDNCPCGSGKAFSECCGDTTSPLWNERANGRIPGSFFDSEHARHVANEPICEFRSELCPPGILVRQLSAKYGLARLGKKIIEKDNVQRAQVRDDSNVSRVTGGRVTDIVEQGELVDQIIALVRRVYADELEPFYCCRFRAIEAPQVLRYSKGSHYKPHADSDIIDPVKRRWKKSKDRDYSLLVYLDSDFEGGELIFPNFNFRLRPEAGMLVAFPSDFRYLHGAMPVLGGIRHAIVSWGAVHG